MSSQPSNSAATNPAALQSTQTGASANIALPQDAQAIVAMLRELGVSEFEPRVISQLLDFAYGYVRDVLGEARSLANHSGQKQIDADDVRLAIQFWSDRSFSSSLPAPGVIAEMAQTRNSQPLPAPRPTGKPVAGLRLPPDRHCLTQATYQLRSLEPSQQKFISSSQPLNSEQRFANANPSDHRTYVVGSSSTLPRPSSTISANQHGSSMMTDYDM